MIEIMSIASDMSNSRRTSKCSEGTRSIKDDLKSDMEKSPHPQNYLNGINQESGGSGFEDAIAATGFGKFNILLLVCSFPGFNSAVYVSSTLAYITSSAECDLQMTLEDMGRLNIYTYIGMITSALIWGFLSDTLGRKKIMVWGFLALSLCELITSMSQTYMALSLAKFFSGFIFNGPFAILISYISEMHRASIRAKVLVYIGIYYSIGNMNLPLIAWGVLPQKWSISLFNDSYVLHSWQIFLALFSIPPLITGFCMMMLPESPKFLMSRGRNEEALKIFQKIFSMNTGLPKEEYPVKKLLFEKSSNLGEGDIPAPTGWEAVKGGWRQIKPMILPPYLIYLLLSCYISLATMLGYNTLRVWFPQIATIVEDFYSKNNETSSLCMIIESHISNKTFVVENDFVECKQMISGSGTYINSLIIGATSLIPYILGGCLVNILGKRKLTALCLVGGGLSGLALYWTSNFPEIVTLFSISVSMTSMSSSVLCSIAVDLFPTEIRAMTVALIMMVGRLGTVIGIMTFAELLNQGCSVPFIFICSILTSGGILSLILPKTTMKKLD